MTKFEIEHIISYLARSQGSWSRTWSAMLQMRHDTPVLYDKFMESLIKKDFKDAVDLILYFEN